MGGYFCSYGQGHKCFGTTGSSRPEVFCKKGVPAPLLKERLWHRCFPVNFVKFLRTPFFIEHL